MKGIYFVSQITKGDKRSVLDMFNAYVDDKDIGDTTQSYIKAGMSTNMEQVCV